MDTHASHEEDKSYESGKESTLNLGSSYIRGHSHVVLKVNKVKMA